MDINVREKLGKELLKDLSAAENKQTRKAVQAARPQLLYLDNLNFINETIEKLVARNRLAKSFQLIKLPDTALKTARDIAEEYQNKYIKVGKKIADGADDIENTVGGQFLKQKFPDAYGKLLNKEVFMFRSFREIAQCKRDIIKEFVKTTKNNLAKITRAVDRGHGGGDGVAVSGVQIAQGMGRADAAMEEEGIDKDAFAEEFENHVQDAFSTGEIDIQTVQDLLKIQISYSQVVDANGNLSASYIPFISFQDKYTNRVTDKAREVAAKNVVERFFQKVGANELASMEGSSSLKEKMIAKALAPLLGLDIKGKKMTIDPRIDPRKIKLKTKGKTGVKNSGAGGAGAFSVTKGRAGQVGGALKKANSSNFSAAAILGNINSKLSNQVASNMGSPALNFRTGRFSSSVRAIDVVETPQGFKSVGYSYDRQPYGVFETTSGSNFADANRDPRVIIDQSIREIAAQMAIGRLYTRRL